MGAWKLLGDVASWPLGSAGGSASVCAGGSAFVCAGDSMSMCSDDFCDVEDRTERLCLCVWDGALRRSSLVREMSVPNPRSLQNNLQPTSYKPSSNIPPTKHV